MNKNQILDSLYAAVDAVYRDFNSSLLPTVDKVRFIGVVPDAIFFEFWV